MQILFCDTLLSVKFVYYVKLTLNIIRFAIPIILIVKITFDLVKALSKIDYDEKNVVVKNAIRRFISAGIFFLIPTFVSIFLTLLGSSIDSVNNTKIAFTKCYEEVNLEVVKKVEEQYNKQLDDEEKKLELQKEINKAKYDAYNQSVKESLENNKNNTNNDNNGDYQSDLTDKNKQNKIYIENGVFYKPKFVSGISATHSGRECPSNPLNQGYNNKYGYNNYFYTMLTKLIEGAKKAGYNLGISSQGCRSYSTQLNYYKTMAKGRAASPGRSNHGWGIASDVTFYKNASKTCGSYRTYSNCPGMKWVHEHAKDYGLRFPLLNASYKEDWHIEPMTIKTYNVSTKGGKV